MTTFADYVQYYNDHDVKGLVEGLVKMIKIENKIGLDIFKDSVSLPGLTQRYLMSKNSEYFTKFAEEHKHIYKELKNGITGGPSIIMHRKQIADETLIKNKDVCKRVIGYDANSLYLDCIAKEMPTGRYILREKDKNYKKEEKHSRGSIAWLEEIMKRENIFIRHARNNPHGEKRIKNFSVDGFCAKTNTVYEYHGCFFSRTLHLCRFNSTN